MALAIRLATRYVARLFTVVRSDKTCFGGHADFAPGVASDGYLYSSLGDGGGFGPNARDIAYVSIGTARLTGASAATSRGPTGSAA